MGKVTITINVDEDLVRKLREMRAREKVGKGFLGRVISEAIKEWAERKDESTISKSLELLKSGIDLGGIISKKREDLHKR